MASDLISREALLEDLRESINWLHKIYGGLEYEDEKRICSAEIASFTEVGMRVKDAPAVDAEPVRHGEWRHLGGDEWLCTICGEVIHTEGSWEKPTRKYCHECGAKMDGGSKRD